MHSAVCSRLCCVDSAWTSVLARSAKPSPQSALIIVSARYYLLLDFLM